ncbi:hypothetical protein B0H13DRAFT_2063984 [Mycena leptocephala]|nr:hypothetical protein B0H13DRAFT_2063984 [Mycena leptocephala]
MSSSAAVNQLVSFLTRPLMRSHAHATIVSLQLCLQSSLSGLPAESSFLLSAKCPPPLAIQRACLVSGMRWAEWIRLLSSGIDLQIFITESSLAVKVGTMPRRILWVAPDTASPAVKTVSPSIRPFALLPAGTPFGARLRTTVVSTRTRRGATCALNPTRIPTLLSYSFDAEELASASDSDADSDCDSESDSDSDISDSGFSFTSASSATSLSTTGGVMLGAPPKPRAIVSSNGRPSGVSQNTVRRTGVWTADSWRRST